MAGIIATAPRGDRRMAPRRTPRRLLLSACAVLAAGAGAWQSVSCWSAGAGAGRRHLLAAVAAGSVASSAERADAFANAVKKIDRAINDAKKLGPQPEDLGLLDRPWLSESMDVESRRPETYKENLEAGILKECSNTPNCFSTTWSESVDVGLHDLNPWRFSGKSPEQAFKEVSEVVAAYPPGQQGIDGGGFKVIRETNRYLYVQYESLRRGHRDDVEFAIKPGTPSDVQQGELLLRSSSRVGTYDYGVNAVRLNKIASDLMKKGGWQIKLIDEKSHPRYWSQNCPAGDSRKAPYVTRDRFPNFCENW
eukprot:gb/GFBE01036595.1/.p1 GENE.gb/GFBE01036595.1/~~gb/GFBE01036595.1/.p1  ORF type:complete len:308 (+),score=53.75 gb/GFBE01036595.1/:1-924(+)